MSWYWIQHVPFEGPAHLAAWSVRTGTLLSGVHPYRGEPFPDADRVDGLFVLGGPMNVYEDQAHPWLTKEKRFLERVIKCGAPVLGICLGAQLIATVLGARVTRNREREIGWLPVEAVPAALPGGLLKGFPPVFTPFHWHGDTFEIPSGAVHLASTRACRNQAFQYGSRVLGLQFHLEVTQDALETMLTGAADELAAGGDFVHTAQRMREDAAIWLKPAQDLLDGLLGNLKATLPAHPAA